MTIVPVTALACLAVIATASQAFPQDNWTQRKCDLYSEAWMWILETQDLAGVRVGFIEEHQAFIDANCNHGIEICPVTKGDEQLADLLTVMSMNQGMASTFVPFACPTRDGAPSAPEDGVK
jgi:hypothetical protein